MRTTQTYMGWAASKSLSKEMLSGNPALVVSTDGARLLWANPSGAALLEQTELSQLDGYTLPDESPLRRQLSHLYRWLRPDRDQAQRLRLGSSASAPLELVRVTRIHADDVNGQRQSGILLQPVAHGDETTALELRATALTDFLAGTQDCAAVLDEDGALIASAGDFHGLRSAADALQAMLDQLAQSDKPARKMVETRPDAGTPERYMVTALRIEDETSNYFLLFAAKQILSIRRSIPDLSKPEPVPTKLETFRSDLEATDHVPGTLQGGAETHQQRSESTSRPGVVSDRTPSHSDATATPRSAASVSISQDTRAQRFVWRMDERLHFTFVSPEFQTLVGLRGAMEGRSWQDIAGDHQLDPDFSVQRQLAKHVSFSGISILWPTAQQEDPVRVDISAMPVLDGDQQFLGYRGFGTVISESVEHEAAPQPSKLRTPGPANENAIPEEQNSQVPNSEIHEPLQQTESDRTSANPDRSRKTIDADAVELTDSEKDAFAAIGRSLGQETSAVQETDQRRAKTRSDDTPTESANVVPARSSVVGDKNPEADGTALKALVNNLPGAVLVVRENALLFANEAMIQLAGYDSLDAFLVRETKNGLAGLDLYPLDALEEPESPLSEGARRMRMVSVDGQSKLVDAHIGTLDWLGESASMLSLWPVAEGARIVSLADPNPSATNDRIGEAWNADELLAILNTATEGVLMISEDGQILAVNHGTEALFGRTSRELTGKDLTHLLAQESHQTALEYLSGLKSAGVASVLNDGREVIGWTATGVSIPLFMTLGPVGPDASRDRFCVVLRDITQWKRAEEDLLAAKRKAEHASSAKSDFLATISHEIRTPLSAILGFSEVILEERFGPIGNDRYRDYIQDIHLSGSHVINLVNDLLDISKIEAGQLDLSFAALNLQDLIPECVSLMQPLANRAHVIIRTSLADNLPRIVADAKTLRQIVLNLMSNAVKFTGEGGQIIVSAALENNGSLSLRVRDTGKGMNAEDLQTAMEPFRQVHVDQPPETLIDDGNNSRVHGGHGTGLGLPLTKALAEANRASFDIESNPESGTLIKITFPSTRVLAE